MPGSFYIQLNFEDECKLCIPYAVDNRICFWGHYVGWNRM